MLGDPDTDRRSFLKYTGAAAAASTVGLAGCLETGGGEIEQLVITQGQFIETPDPNDHITSPYYNIFDHVYEPLFDVTPELEIQSRVVDEWEPTGDGSTDLTIRDDVVFHNGEDLVADDVTYTFRRMLDPEVGPVSDQAAGMGAITEVETVDETTVRVHHPDTAPSLAEFQFGNFARAVKQGWVEDQEKQEGAVIGDSAEAFNGTGPYEVVEYTSDEEIVLETFDDYWGETPDVQEIVFNEDSESSGRANSLIAEESDLVDNVLPDDVSRVQSEDGVEVRNETSLRSIFLVMKNEIAPFDSLEFRQAMNYAVDNQAIIDDVLGGFGAPMNQMHAEGIFGYNPDLDPYEQDLDQAEQLVEDSGYAGAEIELGIPDGRYLNDVAVGETAADQIDQLDNVSCSPNVQEFSSIVEAAAAGVDSGQPFFLIGWGVITGDADYAIDAWINPEGELQTFSDSEAFETLEQSKGETDTDQREQLLQDVNERLHEQCPFVFLHDQDSIYGVSEDIDWEPRRDETIWAWEISQA